MNEMFSLQTRDFIKGLIVFVIGAVLAALYQMLQNGFAVDYNQIIQIAILSGLSYLIKNLFSDSKGAFLGKI